MTSKETRIASEKALSKNWLALDEDKAWAHLQDVVPLKKNMQKSAEISQR